MDLSVSRSKRYRTLAERLASIHEARMNVANTQELSSIPPCAHIHPLSILLDTRQIAHRCTTTIDNAPSKASGLASATRPTDMSHNTATKNEMADMREGGNQILLSINKSRFDELGSGVQNLTSVSATAFTIQQSHSNPKASNVVYTKDDLSAAISGQDFQSTSQLIQQQGQGRAAFPPKRPFPNSFDCDPSNKINQCFNIQSQPNSMHIQERTAQAHPRLIEDIESQPVVLQARLDRQHTYASRQQNNGAMSLSRVSLPPDLPLDQHDCRPQTLAIHDSALVQEEEDDISESKQDFERRLTYAIEQMMFVSGEQAEPSPETTWMIEEIVREQVLEMLKEATVLANRRGSKSISIVDLIFQIRHNPAKVSRLKTFLSWKDVRKNVKDSDDKAGADADALDLEEGALPGANPAAPQKTSTNRKAKLILPWEVQSFYNETVPEREDEEDEEEEEQNEATLARLASADERTKNMTREEYVYWSDCRQASFTFRKGKRFREWAGFGTIIDSKPNDDVVDILGFLTFEIVQTLTEEALKVKATEDLANKKASGSRGDSENNKKRKREGCTLFEMVEEDKTPVEPKHVREAFRRLQIVPKKYTFMRQGYAGVRTPLRMI